MSAPAPTGAIPAGALAFPAVTPLIAGAGAPLVAAAGDAGAPLDAGAPAPLSLVEQDETLRTTAQAPANSTILGTTDMDDPFKRGDTAIFGGNVPASRPGPSIRHQSGRSSALRRYG